MQRRRALGTAVVALALGTAAAVMARGGDGEDRPPPPLRLLAHPPSSAPFGTLREQTFLPSGDLPELRGGAQAYRLDDDAGPARARFEKLRDVFGVAGEVVEYGPGDLQATEDDLNLVVSQGTWNVSRSRIIPSLPDAGARGPAPLDGDAATHDPRPAPGEALPEPLGPDEMEELPGLPDEEQACRIALDALDATGMDTDGATITATNSYSVWTVDVEPRVDGLPAPGLTSSVMVGPGGRIDGASGHASGVEELGTYPLASTRAVVDRLNRGWSDTPPLHDIVTEDAGGPEVEVTGAELVLANQLGWDGATYLVPSYRLAAADDHIATAATLTVPALTDDAIDRRLDQINLDERPERKDLDDPPAIGDTTSESAVVVAPVTTCGIDDVWWGDYRFTVLDPPFDATNAPDEYVGVGEFGFYTGVYQDNSGIVVPFTEVDPEREAPPCDGHGDGHGD